MHRVLNGLKQLQNYAIFRRCMKISQHENILTNNLCTIYNNKVVTSAVGDQIGLRH